MLSHVGLLPRFGNLSCKHKQTLSLVAFNCLAWAQGYCRIFYIALIMVQVFFLQTAKIHLHQIQLTFGAFHVKSWMNVFCFKRCITWCMVRKQENRRQIFVVLSQHWPMFCVCFAVLVIYGGKSASCGPKVSWADYNSLNCQLLPF